VADILEQVKQVFARVMEVDPSQVGPATSPDNLEQWDSVAHVQLVMGLEEQFNLTISPEESIEFENVQNIVDWLEKNLG
jgi:acyl carrier protein